MTSTKQEVYETLRYLIITQSLAPGELLKDKDIMEQYGIGRTPLRDVFPKLQEEGLINRVPRSGTWVAPMDFHHLKEVTEIRIALEGMAGELAAERITEEQIDQLEKILAKVENLEESNELKSTQLHKYESDFHSILYESIGNAQLAKLLKDYQGIGARFWHSLMFSKEQMYVQFKNQRVLLDALKRRDKATSKAVGEDHVRHFLVMLEQRISLTEGV